MRTIVIIAIKEIQEGLRNRGSWWTTLLLAALALSLTFLGKRPYRQRRRRRARRRRRRPVEPDHLPASADRAPDLARRRGRRDGTRHHDASPRSHPVGRGQVILVLFRPRPDPGVRDVIGYGAAAAAALAVTGATRLRRAAAPSPRCSEPRCGLRCGRISDQQPGPGPGDRRRHLGGGMAADGAGVRHGATRCARRRSGKIVTAPVLEALRLNPTDLYRMTNLTGFNVSQFSAWRGRGPRRPASARC